MSSRQIVEKYSDINFDKHPSRGSRVIACGQTYIQIMKTPVDAFRNVEEAPNKMTLLNDHSLS
jgi:hypothetical protein